MAKREKKQKSANDPLRDLLVKLRRVYKDLYIINGSYCIAGNEAEEDSLGDVVCILEDKYQKILKDVIDEPAIYLKPDNVKKALDNFEEKLPIKIIAKIEQDELLKKLEDFNKDFLSENAIWKSVGKIEKLMKVLFEDKRVCELPISLFDPSNATDYVTIAKQFVPSMTEKNATSVFMTLEREPKEDLYRLLFEFNFTHYRFQAVYHVLPLPYEEEEE